jgi:DNA replication ATP-dependent helicase Dna2
MPSTQARTKLRAFQFVEGLPDVETATGSEAEKENHPAAVGRMATKAPGAMKDTAKPANSKTCPPPSTPAMKRLPLADLVGNIDDSSRHAPQPAASPEEQLIWRGSQPANTPLPRNNKRRARSSSPVAPSQEDHMLDAAKRNLTTPQADPAMDLWTRYTHNKGTPSVNKSVTFAHLINESSPRSAAAAGSVSGLRRWASCGHEFPASTRKRRKTHGVFQSEKMTNEDVFAALPSSDGVMLGQPAKSTIASMVQRMKACVSKQQPRLSSQLPSSSSPLPDSGDHHVQSSGSPLQRRAHEHNAETSETMQAEDNAVGESALVEEDEPQRCSGSSDDFGDDDFDSEMVDALDTTPDVAAPPPLPEQATSYVTIPTEPILPPLQRQSSQAVEAQRGSDDDFGMSDDEDGFAADLEQVASLYDTRPLASSEQNEQPLGAEEATPAITSNAAFAQVISLIEDEDDEDEFGDEIDVDVFAAAEVAATQTSANAVRRTRTYS